jgi:hypothetical protein
MADCLNKERNLTKCNCTASCERKGVCCECLQNHLAKRQLPGCCFPAEFEKKYDRSFEAFIKAWS